MRGVEGVNWIRGIDEPGMSIVPTAVHTGGNSGYQAINLAALWGVQRIILLGFDMQTSGRKVHAHADHPPQLGNPIAGNFPVWRERFGRAAGDLRALGVDVVNATRHTALRAFERIALEQAIGPRPNVFVLGMNGLGDNLFQRPFVRELARGHEVYLRTPWPQFYADIAHVTPIRSDTRLRTQRRNERAIVYPNVDLFDVAKSGAEQRSISYARALQRGESIWRGLTETFACAATTAMDLPPLDPCKNAILSTCKTVDPSTKPFAIVRPVTVRREWSNPARNPRAEHVAEVARWLRAEGLHIVSVADLATSDETAIDPLPEADETLHAGELGPLQLLGLVRHASAIVGGVGWIVPAAIAAHVPAFILLGGQGGHNAPERITDPSMRLDLIGWGVPDAFCRCTSMQHDCAKRNTQLRRQFDEWRLRVAGWRATPVVA